MKWIVTLWPLVLCLPFHSLAANNSDNIQELANTNAWKALLYYKKSWTGKLISEIDDNNFFLANDGKVSPYHELAATIDAFNNSTQNDDQALHCKFPARYRWLRKVLPETIKDSNHACSELAAWKAQINSDSVTLIFPSAYLDSPSSMFGHTLLRFDQRDQTEGREILAYTVNYAATKKPDASELGFVYRGLVGGYPGDITVLPYYLKLKEYKDMESRDIWEYKLNLTEAETDYLLDVIWEAKDKRIDYFFFTENCSYRIVSFLNAVRPESTLLDQFHLSAIPLDTIRTLREAHFIESVSYRPSVRTVFDHAVNQLTKEEQQLVLNWVTGNVPFDNDNLPTSTHGSAALLDTAFQYSRMASHSPIDLRTLSYNLLRARKEVAEPSSIEPVAQPDLPDEYGHHSRMIAFAAGTARDQNYLGLTLRAAYHDTLDPPLGYPRGATLKFGEMHARYYEQDHFKIEQADLVAITSIKPRNTFFKPMSWSVKLGGQRFDYRQNRLFAATIKGIAGPAYPLGRNSYLYAMAGADLRIANGYENNHNIYALGEAGISSRTFYGQWQIVFDAATSIFSSDDTVTNIAGKYAFNLGADATLTLESCHCYSAGQHETFAGISAKVFF